MSITLLYDIIYVKEGKTIGTNYYLHFHRSDIENGIEGTHIGKNSCGWAFQFEAHSNPSIKTVSDMRSFTKLGFIYDEYDREHTYEDFWKIVEDSKVPIDGEAPYVLSDPNYPDEPVYGYEDEGFAFIEGDFC